MGAERLSMRKIREILRLRFEFGLSHEQIARSVNVAKGTVNNYLYRARHAGLDWRQAQEYDDGKIEEVLFPPPATRQGKRRPVPDWEYIQQEHRKKYVTLMLLWLEYKREQPDGYQYTQFCTLYHRWKKTIEVSMRQDHKAGEKLFIDYAEDAAKIVDPKSGTATPAHVFLTVLGASNYTFAEATTRHGPCLLDRRARARVPVLRRGACYPGA